MNRSIIFSLIVVLFSSYTVKAQVPELAPMNKPIKYISPSEDVSLFAETDNNKFRPGSYWIVFSDRGNNVTYESDSSNKTKKKLELLDVYLVAEEKGEWVHIVKDDKLSKVDLESNFSALDYANVFSPSAEDYGWIRKDHLLLWQKCITTKVGNFNKKGMVLNTVEITMKKDLKKEKSNEFYFFNDPESSISSENKSRVYEVLYIYKIDNVNKSVLLGRSERVTVAGKVKNTILGWMKLENVTIWDTRIASEPNWNTDAAAERRSGEKAKIYRTESQARKYGNRAIWEQDPFEKRNIGQWRRFPVLSEVDSEGIVKVGVMGELKTVGSGETIADTEWASVREKYNALRAKRSRINVVFVVDGTLSMQPYFKPISKAIQNSMATLRNNSQNKGQSIKFGAVAYTDNAEDKYNKLTQVQRLGTYSNLVDWFNNLTTFHKDDKDTPEALFYGLNTGIRATGISPDETNVIVLIGDAGNHNRNDKSQVDSNVLKNSLFKFNCNICAIQVHHEMNVSYKEFKSQLKDIIKSTAELKYEQNVDMYKKLDINVSKPDWIPVSRTNDVLDTTTIIGSIVYCNEGESISPNVVQNEIEKTVNSSYNLTIRNLNMLQDIIERGGDLSLITKDAKSNKSSGDVDSQKASFEEASVYTPAIIDYLRALEIDDEKLKILMKENYQLYMPGYTQLRVEGQEYPLFNFVLFMSNQELGNLLTVFDDLIDATTGFDQRSEMKAVWLDILEKHVGDEFSREEMENMTFEEINRKVFGLPGTSNLLTEKLSHLTNPSIISDDKIFNYVRGVARKRQELSNIFNSENYPYSFMSNDIKYFWISQEILP